MRNHQRLQKKKELCSSSCLFISLMSSYRTSLSTTQRFKVDVRFYDKHKQCICCSCVTPRPTYFKPPGLLAWTSLVSAGVYLRLFRWRRYLPLFCIAFEVLSRKNTKFITYSQNARADSSASYSKRLGSRPIVVVKHQLSNYQIEELCN